MFNSSGVRLKLTEKDSIDKLSWCATFEARDRALTDGATVIYTSRDHLSSKRTCAHSGNQHCPLDTSKQQ